MKLASAVALALALASCGGKTNPQPGGDTADGSGSAMPPTPDAALAAECVRTGCSGSLCAPAGSDIVTTCEMRPEYACYEHAQCEKQSSGECGFTQTPELKACVANPPPL